MESNWPDFAEEPGSEEEIEDEILQERQRDRGRKMEGSDVVAELMAIHERMMQEMVEHASDPDESGDSQSDQDAGDRKWPEE